MLFSEHMPVWAGNSPLVRQSFLAELIEPRERAAAWFLAHREKDAVPPALFGIFARPDETGAVKIIADECGPQPAAAGETDLFIGFMGAQHGGRPGPQRDRFFESLALLEEALREAVPEPDWTELRKTGTPIHVLGKCWALVKRIHGDDVPVFRGMGINPLFEATVSRIRENRNDSSRDGRRDLAVALSDADRLLRIKPFCDSEETESREALRMLVLDVRREKRNAF